MKEQLHISPPRWANKFLEWYCHQELIDEIQGDLIEQFHKNSTNKGHWTARTKFIIDVIRFFRPSSLKQTQYFMHYDIIINYLKVAFRVFRKEKGYTFTNIVGLALGITCSLFIYLWVQDELKYNQFPEENHLVHYLKVNMPMDHETVTWWSTPYPLKAVLDEKYPALEKTAVSNWGSDLILEKGSEKIQIEGLYSSAEIFDIFSIPVLKGSTQPLFEKVDAIAISSNLAERLYGSNWSSQDLIGKSLTDHEGNAYSLAAIFKDLPRQSTLQFEYVLPFEKRLATRPWLKNWGNYSNLIYVKINPEYNTQTANENIRRAITDNRPEEEDLAELFLHPFPDVYLRNEFENGVNVGGRIQYVRLLSIAAILVLVLASINFINLSTARSAKRAKEAGVRKVMGAVKRSLRVQFIVESILITAVSFTVASVLVFLLLPYFNFLTEKAVTLDFLSGSFLLLAVGFIVIVGFISGLYPAVFMARMDPVKSLKGIISGHRGNHVMRKSLLVFQFVITTIMIVGSITVYSQLQYIFEKNTGMDRENVIKVYMGDMDPTKDFKVYKDKLLKMPGIKSVATTDQNPIEIGNSTGDPQWPGRNPESEQHFFVAGTDPDYIPLLDMKLKAGRNFDWNLKTDTVNYIINETCARLMGVEDPVGMDLSFWDNEGKIIGVVQDFNFHSLKNSVEPLILRYEKEPWMILVKTKEGETKEALASLEAVHNEFNPARKFEFYFLDQEFNSKYQSEQLVSKLTLYFTIMAIVISCLGLLGLVSFTTQLKTKEIGIRKVLGASVKNILGLISKEFLLLVGLSILISTPIAYLILKDWLQNFAYQIDLSVWLFILSGFISISITLVIIAEQGIRAAFRNPVESLRNE